MYNKSTNRKQGQSWLMPVVLFAWMLPYGVWADD